MSEPTRPTLQARLVALATSVVLDPTSPLDEVAQARAIVSQGGYAVDHVTLEARLAELDPVTLHKLRDLIRSL